MCFLIFKSEAKPSLRAFGGDLTGSQLPSQFRPWRAVGAVAPGQQPPYKLPRDVIKGRLRPKAFNFFVLAKPNEQSPREMCEDEASALRLSLKSGGAAQTADGYSKIGLSMSKEELLQFEGLVLERMPNARYLVQLDNRHQLVAYTAGRMKKNRIKTLAEDRVTVEVSLCDLKGRLIFRHRTNEPLWSRGSRNAVNSAGDDAEFDYFSKDVAGVRP